VKRRPSLSIFEKSSDGCVNSALLPFNLKS